MKKTCVTCGETKDTSEFYTRRGSKDGYTANCKVCMRERSTRQRAETTSKQCSRCGAAKPVSEFYKRHTTKDGLYSTCKDCMKETISDIYAQHAAESDGTPNVEEKRCPHCGETKPASEFCVSRGTVSGLSSWCRKCMRQKQADIVREHLDNGLCFSCGRPSPNGTWRCPDCAAKERERMSEYMKTEEAKEAIRKYERERWWSDPQYRIKQNLRRRLHSALNGRIKNGSAIRDLGCSVGELIVHLESQFSENMSWDNYGSGDRHWEIDHIIPLSSVDLTKRENVKKVCHYTNLRPLWGIDNIMRNFGIEPGEK